MTKEIHQKASHDMILILEKYNLDLSNAKFVVTQVLNALNIIELEEAQREAIKSGNKLQ